MKKILLKINSLIEKKWGQLVLIGLVMFVIFSPFLLGLKVNNSIDATCVVFPVYGFYKQVISQNQSFFINPYFLNGYPSYASAVIGFWSPINYLFFRFLPVGLANHLLLFLYMFFGSWVLVQLFKEWGFSSAAGLIAAFTFILTTNAYIDLPVIVNNLWLPLMLWLTTLIKKHNSWWLTILTGLILGLGWLTAHTNWLVVGLAGVFLYIIFLTFFDNQKNKKWNLIIKYLVVFLISGVVALIQFIPNIITLMLSVRNTTGFLMNNTEITEGTINLNNLVNLFLPFVKIPRLTDGNFISYIGILPLIFAIFTLVNKKNKKYIFWQIIALFCILVAWPNSLLFKVLIKLPIIGFLRQPTRWLFLGLFALSVLAGFGFDEWRKNIQENLKKKFYNILKWCLIVALAGILILNIINLFFNEKILNNLYNYFDTHLYAQTTHLPLEHYHSVIKDQYLETVTQFSFLNLKLLLQILVLILGLLVLKFFWFKEKNREFFAPTVVLVCMITLLAIYPFFIGGVPASYIANYESKTAQFIKKNPGKIFPFLQSDAEFEKLNKIYQPNLQDTFLFESELMVPNMNIYYGLTSADGHDSLMPSRYASLIALLGSSRVRGAGFMGENLHDLGSLEEKIEVFNSRQNLVDLLGIDYVISVFELIENENFSRVYTTTSTPFEIPFYVYQNTNPLPFIFLTPKVQFLISDNLEQNLEIIKNPKNDFHQLNFIECKNCGQTENELLDFSKAIKNSNFKIISRTNTRIEIEYMGEDNWLIINQTHFPGWEATLDNVPTEIYHANLAQQGIFVPQGKHKIVIEYHYPIKYFLKNIKEMF